MTHPGTADAAGHARLELGLYVLGVLSEDDRAAVEAHQLGCAACQAEYDAISDLHRLLAPTREAVLRLLESVPALGRPTRHSNVYCQRIQPRGRRPGPRRTGAAH